MSIVLTTWLLPDAAPGANSPTRAAQHDADVLLLVFRRGEVWWRVGTRGGVLLYERGRGDRVIERHESSPNDRAWQRFWSTVERLGVWRWADSFRGEGGGEEWELRLVHAGRRLGTSGRSAFPPLAASSPSPGFLALVGAVSQLVGTLPPFP